MALGSSELSPSFSHIALEPTRVLATAAVDTSHAHFTTKRRAELSPTPTQSCLEVVLAMSTTVFIPDYYRYYTTPIESFRPTLLPQADGSLTATPFLDDIAETNLCLLFIGALLMIFLRNTIVSADYIRRGHVKNKSLFHVLLVSQLLGFLTFVISAATNFADKVNCRLLLNAEGVLSEVSTAMLLSGILGMKAYKCLNDSKWVFAIIALLQTASTTLIFVDLAKIQAIRRLAKSCSITSKRELFPIGVILRLLIALFICCCFIYALWKSSKIPAAQGRISLRLAERPPEVQPKVSDLAPRPRGWWDYVAEANPPHSRKDNSRASSWVVTEDQGFLRNMRTLFRSLWISRKRPERRPYARTSQLLTKQATVRFSEKIDVGVPTARNDSSRSILSASRKLSRLTTRMQSFREAMRNELAHTALIAVTSVVAAALGLIGMLDLGIPDSQEFFMNANWAVLSLLVIHSFGRVVARSEREAQMQHPSAWDPTFKVHEVTSTTHYDEHLQRALSSASVSSNPYRRRRDDDAEILDTQITRSLALPSNTNAGDPVEDPFEDFEPDMDNAYPQISERAGDGFDDSEYVSGRSGVTHDPESDNSNVRQLAYVPPSPSAVSVESILRWEPGQMPSSFRGEFTDRRSVGSEYSVPDQTSIIHKSR